MSDPCRNDCVEPLRFPRQHANRPGLTHIDFRIGAYGEFREFLLRRLNADPVLQAWTHRETDDPGIALLEGAAILGDILTFYQELYANEVYLGTAKWRDSVADLVRLIGYRLTPGLGGRATFAFTLKGDAPVTVPKDFPVTATLAATSQKADFATVDEIVAYPWLSSFNLSRPYAPTAVSSATKELIVASLDPAAVPVEIKAGDRLFVGLPYPLFNPTRLVGGEIVVVDSVRKVHGYSVYKIKGGLTLSGSVFGLAAFKIGRTFRHLGNSAPPTKTVVSGSGSSASVSQSSISFRRWLDQSTTTDVSPTLEAQEIPLATQVDDLPQGATILLQGRMRRVDGSITYYTPVDLTNLRKIAGQRAASYTWGALTAPTTVLVLDQQLTTTTNPSVDTWNPSSHTYNTLDVRDLQIHETLSPILPLVALPDETSAASGHNLLFDGTDADAQSLKGRRIMIAKPGADPVTAVVQSVQSLPANVADVKLPRTVTLDIEVDYADFPNETPTVPVYGNLADAVQGKIEREATLGNGDAREVFQTFKLPKAPLTYLRDSAATPPLEPELEIYVDDRLWSRVDLLFGRGAKEQVYIVREDADQTSWVQFGDGKTGARLPSGRGNVVARFRTGTGAYGDLQVDTKPQAGGRIDRLDKIFMPSAISGGAEAESGDAARRAAPGKVQSLDRLVSVTDFEAEALATAGIRRASAAWRMDGGSPAIVVTVLMESGRADEADTVSQSLARANRCRGPQRFPVLVHLGSLRKIYLDLAFGLDPTYREDDVTAAVRAVLGLDASAAMPSGLFAVDLRGFGEPEYATRIEGIVQNVAGVLWAQVKGLGPVPTSGPPSPPWPFSAKIACADDEILALSTDNLSLAAVAVQPTEAC